MKINSYKMMLCRRWPLFSLSSGVLVKVQMFGVLLLVAGIDVFVLRTVETLVDGGA